MSGIIRRASSSTLCAAALLPAMIANTAQAGEASTLLEVVTVTATKKEHAENVQDVPLAVTAYGSEQLEALNFKNLASLSYTMPNVQLENIGTTAATANFSIRGLGINSSIPSIDPTVGVFVDGVYMGINSGVLFDSFDVDSIEILRGPQGVLFGRNVTGGAVLLRTKAPGETFEMNGRVAGETGPNYIADLSLSGPIVEGVLSGKLAVYHNDDAGSLTNKFDNSRFGEARQTIVRPALRWMPTEQLELLLRLEHGEADGDGPAGQNHALFARDSFDFSIDEEGFFDSEWNQAFLETRLEIGLGAGAITNILGWREYESTGLDDIDSTPALSFHAGFVTEQDQISDELRYAGTFGPAEVTSGLYYFQQDLLYLERRLLANGLVDRTGGGDGDFSTSGAFAAVDWALSESFKLNLGLRYTREKKEAAVSTIRAAGGSIVARTIVADFSDSESWDDISPRIGLQWMPGPASQVYAYWAKGFRSGGYNFRNTDPGVPPGPFDSEDQSSFELGWKQDLAEGRLRVNVAAFHNKISRIQREINTPGALGVTQVIRNVGDATIQGGEIEARMRVLDGLTIALQAGYADGEYDSIDFDLNGDSAINAGDFALQLPRLSPWTYGASVIHDLQLGSLGELSTQLHYNHRDASFYTDNNRGTLNAADVLNANFTFYPAAGPLSFTVYATNLLDETTFGGDTQLPNSPAFGGGVPPGSRPPPTFSPLNKGRVIGAEVRLKF
jgi:iron complex outermembrane receptor protein